MEANRVIVNTNTGEVERELQMGDRVVAANTSKFLSEYVTNFNADKRFVKIYDGVVPLLRKELTPQEMILTISIMPYVCYNDCIIRACPDNRGKMLNLKELAEIMDMDYAVLRRIMAQLKRKGVVAKVEVSEILKNDGYTLRDIWIVNPYIYFRGDHVNQTVMSIFENTKWNVPEQ